MNNTTKWFDILTISLSVLYNYFDTNDDTNKIIFWSVSNEIFRYFGKTVLSIYIVSYNLL